MRAIFAGVVVTGLWAAIAGVQYVMAPALRYRAESAWFLFAAVLLSWAIVTRSAGGAPAPTVPAGWSRRDKIAGLILLVAASIALYLPVLSIGLLSDDFVLLQRARSGALLDRSWDYVRPLPLAIWQAADTWVPSSIVPQALHALNAMLHGLNAWLVGFCASLLGLSRAGSVAAALLFLSSPLGVEPVAWASGIFDLIVSAAVMTAAVILLAGQWSATVQIGLVSLCTVIALASKETAVAMPLLLAALWRFADQDRRKTLSSAALASLAIVGVYVVWRFSSIGLGSAQIIPGSGYELKEMLSRPFGALGLPVHRGIVPGSLASVFVLAVFWPAAFVRAAWTWREDRRQLVFILFAAVWVLISIVPLSAMLFVGADLQGSRYLYLASGVWSIATTVLVAGVLPRPSAPGTAILTILIAGSVAIVIAHQRPWIRAGLERDYVLAAFADVSSSCTVTAVHGLPDHVHGAYVFRNGFVEAAAAPRNNSSAGADRCTVRWTGRGFSIER